MRPLPALTSAITAAAVIAVGGCGDEPLAAPAVPSPPVEVPLGLSGEDQASLGTALLFVSQQSVRGLQQRGPAEVVATAFATLAGRIEGNDRAGTDRALTAARLAIGRYRDLAHDGAAAADLEAMDLTLLRAAAVVTAAWTHPPTTIDTERQP